MSDTQIALKEANKSPRHLREFCQQNCDNLLAAMPHSLSKERFIATLVKEFAGNPKLKQCTPESVIASIQEAAMLGLEINGVLGHAFLIPYGKECTLQTGYRGLIDLVRRSGEVSTLTMEAVYKGDHFEYALGDEGYIRHVPNGNPDASFDNDDITHFYVTVKMKDGGVQRKVWPRKRVEQHRDRYARAANKKDSPWHTHFDIMGKKTVLRDMVNRGELPVAAEAAAVTIREERNESNQWKQVSVSDVSFEPTPEEPEEKPKKKTKKPPAGIPAKPSLPEDWRADFEKQLAQCTAIEDVSALFREYKDKVDTGGMAYIMEACDDRQQQIETGAIGDKAQGSLI
jgi:recombination protein RecT